MQNKNLKLLTQGPLISFLRSKQLKRSDYLPTYYFQGPCEPSFVKRFFSQTTCAMDNSLTVQYKMGYCNVLFTQTLCLSLQFLCSNLFVCYFLNEKKAALYLVWGEAEAAGGISEDSQVIPQRPAWTTAASGCTFSFPPHMLLAQILELSLGMNLYQTRERFFEHMPSFETNSQKNISFQIRQCT